MFTPGDPSAVDPNATGTLARAFQAALLALLGGRPGSAGRTQAATPPLSDKCRLRTDEKAVATFLGGGSQALQPATGALRAFNRTGWLVWQKCREGASWGELKDLLYSEFPEMPRSWLEQDLQAYVGEMRALGLLVVEQE